MNPAPPDYQKLTAALLSRQQMIDEAARHSSKTRWTLFILGLVFFIVAKIVMLKTEFKEIFDFFKTGGNAQFACSRSNDATDWNIVLNVAYPWLGRLTQEQPLTQEQAQFLWDSIRGHFIPSQAQIDDPSTPPGAACQGLGITPLAYMCGDILGAWSQAFKPPISIAQALKNIKTDPTKTPWGFFLTANSKILNDEEGLIKFTGEGFWGVAKWVGGPSPKDMFNYIFDQVPPPAGCDTGSQIAGIAGGTATFTMAGSAFGPEGAVAGAVVGLGLSLFAPTNGCQSGCTIL